MELHLKYKTLLGRYGIDTPLKLAHFFAQLDHESGLKPISENLNYSKKGLLLTFKKYFTELEALMYERKPEKIANRVYANRMGNGNEASGDGYRYRGRGFIQLTGKDNYTNLTKKTGIDFINNPDALLTEPSAMTSACIFWFDNGLNKLAELDDIHSITKRINGGFNGLEHRKELLVKYKNLFNV